MLTITQIKAARSLLSWDQKELATAAHISRPALSNLERGAVSPRQKTLDAIQKALENAGIEFIDGPGVRFRQEILRIDILEGKEAIKQLFEDIYATLRQEGGELLVGGINERLFMKARISAEPLVTYLRKINRRGGIRSKILVAEGDTAFVGKPETSIYRWVDKATFGLVPFYIYRDKYAVLLWGPPLRVVISHNASLAETYRRQFDANWKRAKLPPEQAINLQKKTGGLISRCLKRFGLLGVYWREDSARVRFDLPKRIRALCIRIAPRSDMMDSGWNWNPMY